MKISNTVFKLFSVICLSSILIACGLGGGAGSVGGSDPLQLTVLHGSVGDGPVIGSRVEVYSKDGELLATQNTDSKASYELNVRAKKSAYPLTVKSIGGTDIVSMGAPDFEMSSYVEEKLIGGKKRININPFSTMIHKIASNMENGLSPENIQKSKDIVLAKLNFGFDTSVMPDPVTTEIDASNIALIIRSSEAVGEMVRRTRNTMRTRNAAIDGDAIIKSLAADLTDGVIDGVGGADADPRTAAVANVASVQVLLETMRGELKVNNADATTLMNNAISTSLPGESVAVTVNDVAINAEMIEQTKATLEVVKAVDSNTDFTAAETALDSMVAGTLPETADDMIALDAVNSLDTTLQTTADADEQTLELANTAIQTEEPTQDQDIVQAPVNSVPSIAGTPLANVQEGESYYFAPVANDADGDSLTFSVVNKPVWAIFNPATGALVGNPGVNHVGSTTGITIFVSDGLATASLPAFNITVAGIPNSAPTISGTSASSVQVATYYRFVPTTSDADWDELSFSISNKPSWASFNATTGRLSGTPSMNHIGVTSGIRISVTDGTETVALPSFSITVTGIPNSAPTISGTASSSVVEGNVYSFAPTASDVDGDSLTFSINNKPSWLSFNPATGALTGTPDTNDIATVSGITITVSDGVAATSLPAFAITVSAAPVASTGTASLSWLPPTENTDGSTLANLAGYKIYYGTEVGNYTTVIDLDNPGLTSHVVENLAGNNTYHFVMTAYDANDNESGYSSVGSKTIQ